MRRRIISKHNTYKGLPCIKTVFYIPVANTTRDIFHQLYTHSDDIEEIFVNGQPIKSTQKLIGGYAYTFTNDGNYNVEYYFKKNTTNLNQLFKEVNALKSVVFYDWKNTEVTNISNMFNFNKGIQTIDFNDFNFKKITSADSLINMYNESNKTYLTSSLTLIKFNLNSKTENFQHPMNMFRGCTQIKSIDMTNFDLKSGLFGLTDGGVNQFVNRMFDNCTKLESVYIYSSAPIQGVRVTDNMFSSTTPGKLYCLIKSEEDKNNYSVFQTASDLGKLGNWEIVYIEK